MPYNKKALATVLYNDINSWLRTDKGDKKALWYFTLSYQHQMDPIQNLLTFQTIYKK